MNQADQLVSAVVLGAMQDGGLPHIGCRCSRCSAAISDPSRADYAACLAIVDRRGVETAVWIFDATPDIKWQLDSLAADLGPHSLRPNRFRQPAGIFLTHAHLGHIGGLPQLGPEAMAVEGLKVYGSAQLLFLLQSSPLWQPAVSRLELVPLRPDSSCVIAPHLSVTPILVPHRDEWGAGTFAYHIEGPRQSLLYLPDIDAWDLWPEAEFRLAAVDIALVDGSFFSNDELGGRDPAAHPLVPDTVRRFANLPGQLILTHLNHTNPLLDADSPERQWLAGAGVHIASQGQIFPL